MMHTGRMMIVFSRRGAKRTILGEIVSLQCPEVVTVVVPFFRIPSGLAISSDRTGSSFRLLRISSERMEEDSEIRS
jgi:hypothetical protein